MERDYVKEILEGSDAAVARLITWLEDEDQRAGPFMERLHPHTGGARIIGITGAHGVGKSTLTDRLTHKIRQKGLTVGIVAIDPSSPFSGGALLGDRIRMSQHNVDPGVYIRSMATRGCLGGTANATADVVKILDASGKDVIIIETVGVGQDELDIMDIADTVCLVLAPGLGDAIQTMKAGIMEIADIYVLNKADRQGTDQLHAEICVRIEQDRNIRRNDWTACVVKTAAVDDTGIDDLWKAIIHHGDFLENTGRIVERRRDRIQRSLLRMIHNELFRLIRRRLEENGQLDACVTDILHHVQEPYGMVRDILNRWIPADPRQSLNE